MPAEHPPSIPAADVVALDRIRQGDVAAFEELFRTHWTSLCTTAVIYTHDMTDAEEIVATIFADLWMRRETLQITVKLRTYLHSAVKHRTLNWRRDRSRRDVLTATLSPTETPGMGPAPVAPDLTLEQTDLFTRALDAVNTLPDRYRLAFIYRWRDDWDYADIAAAFGISVNAAQALVSRALKMIRVRLGGT